MSRRNSAITVGRKEILLREVNERVAEVSREAPEGTIEVLCECGDETCLTQIVLTPASYDAVRSVGTHFVVAPGHEHLFVEQVVESHAGYLIVEVPDPAARADATSVPRR